MDHNEAVRQQAAEKYVLGELLPALRDEYEEHSFDCAECALELKAAAAFVDASREVLRHVPEKSLERNVVAARGRWFGWLRPMIAVPAFAALVLMVVYQNTITIPRAKEEKAQGAGQLFSSSFSLRMANTRGGEEVKVRVHAEESFGLDFDFTPSRSFDSYLWQLQDESGRAVLQDRISGSSANKEAHLVVPGGSVRPGKYSLVFFGDTGAPGQPPKGEVLRLKFVIEFLV